MTNENNSAVLAVAYEPAPEDLEAVDTSRPVTVGGCFEVSDKGVYWIEASEEKGVQKHWLCSRLDIIARTRNTDGREWGSLLSWRDPDNRLHEWPVPWELIAGDGTDIRRELMSRGLRIAPQTRLRAKFLEYVNTSPKESALCVSRVGWFEGRYILPDQAFGDGGERVLFQTTDRHDHAYTVAGTLADWQENVARFCVGNSRLAFAVSCAFAAPLLMLAGEDSGGFHLQGGSSTGKTTALKVAASAWGGPKFPQNWRATANGLEAVAELHNDALLCLDEIGQADGREAGDAIYMLANGTGKVRANRTGGARSKRGWRTLFLSTGEISLRAHMLSAAKQARAGQDVRLADIPMIGLTHLHGFESADKLARHLGAAAGQYYGTAIREFLARLAKENHEDVASQLREWRDGFIASNVPEGATGEVSRVAGRFALVAVAGLFATSLGILSWPEDEAAEAVRVCFRDWLESRGTVAAGDVEAAIAQIRGFIEAHGSSRFESLRDGEHEPPTRIINRAGFRYDNNGETEWLILREAFERDACKGFDARTVARALRDRGMLKGEDGNRLMSRLPINHPELKRSRVYRLLPSLFGDESCEG